MKFLKQALIFFSGSFKETGAVSMTRVISFLLCSAGIAIAFAVVILSVLGKPVMELIGLTATLLTFGTGLKYAQKHEEVKTEIEEIKQQSNG